MQGMLDDAHRAAPSRRPGARPHGPLSAVAGALLAAILAAGRASAEAPAAPSGADAAPARTIALQGDRLTVQVTDVALDDVLQAIAAPSKAEIRGTVKQPHSVTVEFTDAPLRDGLTRLLGDQNFLLTYREDGSLRTLTLLGGPLEPSTEARIVKAAPTSTTQPPASNPTDLLQRPVPITGKLQQIVGQPTATMQQLLDITLRQEDASVRAEALRVGMNAVDTVPDLRDSVVRSLQSTDDAALTSLLRNMAPDRIQEILAQMAGSRTPEIRSRSMTLLRNLGANAQATGTP